MKQHEEITRDKYAHYLKLPYDVFKKALHMTGFWDKTPPFTEGYYDYSYCISEDKDNDSTRLSYINYLINEKGFKL